MQIKEKIDLWDYLKTVNTPIALYGMGDGADKILKVLGSKGIKVSAIFCSDSFVRNKMYRGFEVVSYSKLKERMSDFLVLVAFGTQSEIVMNDIYKIASEREVYAPDVPVYGTGLFDMEFVNANIDKFQKAYDLLADDFSKQVFEDTVNFKLSGKLKYLTNSESSKEEIFEILNPQKEEIFADLGAFNGDTIRELLRYTQKQYKKIIAMEPDPKTYKKLRKYIDETKLENTQTYNMASWEEETTLIFDSKSSRGSSMQKTGVETLANSLDNILNGGAVTFIKMDVEGAEHKAILGARKSIEKYKPKLNIAAYHRDEDMFDLILLLNEINPSYKFYFRHHPYIPSWDTNIYGV